MAYCDADDLTMYLDEATLIQLSDDDADGVADDGVIDEAIDAADAEIDGYCSSHYSVPLSPVPVIVRRLSAKIAIYTLYLRRPEAAMPEKWEIEIRDCRRMLEQIARGFLQLGVGASGSESGESAEAARTEEEQTMSFDNLEGY